MLKGNPLGGQNFKQITRLFALLGRRNGQTSDYMLIHGLWPVVRQDSRGLGRNMIKELLARESEKIYVEMLLRTGK